MSVSSLSSSYKLKTFDFTTPNHISEFQLPLPSAVTYIGDFYVEGSVVVAEGDWDVIENLAPGWYGAFRVDDNLMIVHESDPMFNEVELTPQAVRRVAWTNSGAGVGVDGGTFGFFDKDVIDLLNNGNAKLDSNDLLFYVKFKDGKDFDGIIVNKDNIEMISGDLSPLTDFEESSFGVMAGTGTGDGGFSAYIELTSKGTPTKALLLGGLTELKLSTSHEE
jgi:hypothetical protein